MGSREGTFLNSPKLSRNVLVQKAFAQHRARRGHSEILLRAPFLDARFHSAGPPPIYLDHDHASALFRLVADQPPHRVLNADSDHGYTSCLRSLDHHRPYEVVRQREDGQFLQHTVDGLAMKNIHFHSNLQIFIRCFHLPATVVSSRSQDLWH